LLVFRAAERVAAFGLDLGLVMGSSEVCATPSVAPPQPRPANRPAGQDPEARLSRPKSPQQRSDQARKPVNSEQDSCSFPAIVLTQKRSILGLSSRQLLGRRRPKESRSISKRSSRPIRLKKQTASLSTSTATGRGRAPALTGLRTTPFIYAFTDRGGPETRGLPCCGRLSCESAALDDRPIG
jgi:hypothetical protein